MQSAADGFVKMRDVDWMERLIFEVLKRLLCSDIEVALIVQDVPRPAVAGQVGVEDLIRAVADERSGGTSGAVHGDARVRSGGTRIHRSDSGVDARNGLPTSKTRS